MSSKGDLKIPICTSVINHLAMGKKCMLFIKVHSSHPVNLQQRNSNTNNTYVSAAIALLQVHSQVLAWGPMLHEYSYASVNRSGHPLVVIPLSEAAMWGSTRTHGQPCYQGPSSLRGACWGFPVTAVANAIPAFPAPLWPQPDTWYYVGSLPGGGGWRCELMAFNARRHSVNCTLLVEVAETENRWDLRVNVNHVF